MKKIVVVLLVILGILLILLGYALYIFFPLLFPGEIDSGSPNVPEVRITYQNFEEQLAQQGLVRDMPEDGIMVLRFYRESESGRTWENSYVLRQSLVEKGNDEFADIFISMDSKYLETLTNKNLCSTISEAKQEGDVLVEFTLSQKSLAWKYRSMLKYKECLGL